MYNVHVVPALWMMTCFHIMMHRVYACSSSDFTWTQSLYKILIASQSYSVSENASFDFVPIICAQNVFCYLFILHVDTAMVCVCYSYLGSVTSKTAVSIPIKSCPVIELRAR